MRMTRKQFFKAGFGAVGALLGLAALGAVPGCGGSGNGGGSGGSGTGGSGTGGSGGSGTGGSGTAGAGGSGTAGAGGSSSTACANGVSTVIQLNHGHVWTVTPAEVAAAVAKDYHIQGTATHDHVVSMTAADFAKLAQGQSVTKTSTVTAGHSHVVIATCT